LARVVPAILTAGGAAIITADHGNAEQMWDFEANSPQTQHTTNPVPLILVDGALRGAALRDGGRLCDIAPTILAMLGIAPPPAMDGLSLL
jgi:2,3-bisphosphoglycerate-independent phosphoglycerate mutase